MYIDKPVKQKRSLGALRKANKTKPKSPDLTGTDEVAEAYGGCDRRAIQSTMTGRRGCLQHRGMEKSRLQRSISHR